MYSKIAEASSALVSQCRRSNSSSCKVPKKLSAMALSRASPIEPIEPRMPAARNRLPKAQEVYWANSIGRGNTGLLSQQ